MRRVLSFVVVLGVAWCVTALYDAGDDVVELTESNFQKLVLQGDEVWMVEFYAPWCGHCQRLAPEWKKAATALKGVVKVGAVDADQHKSLGGQYQIQGFPTIKVFGANKQSPQDYQGARSADAIVQGGLSAAQDAVRARMGGKKSGGSSGGGGGGGGKSGGGSTEDVIQLTDSNFEEKVINSEEPWLVEFFAPWCGHCKNLAPHWAQAATELKGKVHLGAVDATVHSSTAGRFQVRGYPTIKFFPAGRKSWDSAQEYDGGRTSQDIVQWAMDRWTAQLPPPEIYQLTDQGVFDSCKEKQLCVLSFLPHILDSGADQRNQYIQTLKTLGDRFKQRAFGWVWLEAGALPEAESAVGVGGFGYPAMVAINVRKKYYASLTGPFSESGIHEFLRDLMGGRGRTAVLKGDSFPPIPNLEPWDGKDGELPQLDDDYDLSDFDMDEEEEAKREEL